MIKEIAHHVNQRGNFRITVFDSEQDRQYYISLLKKYARRYGLQGMGLVSDGQSCPSNRSTTSPGITIFI